MIFNSIRWRLQAWHGLILVVVLAGFGATAYRVARENQLRRIDEELQQRLAFVFRPGPPRPPPPPEERSAGKSGPDSHAPREPREERRRDPEFWRQRMQTLIEQAGVLEGNQTNTFYYVMWNGEGSVVARSAGAPADLPMPTPSEQDAPGPRPRREAALIRTRGQQRELAVFLPLRDCILVGRSMAADLAAMRRLALWLGAAGAGVLALGLGGGWWLATRAIRPIEDISASAVKIAAGDLSQRINARDTESELGRLATVLNSTFARLEAAFAHQVRFTADASHELRTPISVILSQTQGALSRERSPEEYRDTLAACQRAAQRMRKLTESLLQLARLDAGEEPMKRERFDLGRVGRDAVELVRPLAAERGIEIVCELPMVECRGDAEQLEQVAVNLLSNAIHFNRDKGEIRVSTMSQNGTAWLVVRDTGEGIPAADLPHIFERFYRVDKSRSRVQGRTGLGLAICKAIVEAHSGELEASSQPGAGSTFTVKLPTS